MEEWHAILNERGWLANHWPEQYGGPGWSAVQKFIFENECALAGAPRIVPFGVNMLGPVLIKYGSEAQKQLLAAAHPRWLRLVVPGLFRAGLGFGPGVRQDDGGARSMRKATTTSSTARRPGPRWASTPT